MTAMKLAVLLASGCVLAGAASAQGVYRDDGPPPVYRDGPAVLTPPPQSNGAPAFSSPSITRTFTGRYADLGSPRLAVWWNRKLSDSLMSTANVQTTDDRSHRYGPGYSDSSRTLTTGVNVQPEDSSRASPAEADDWRIADAFNNTFMEAGAQMLDRNVMMRAFGFDQGVTANTNLQELEVGALLGTADLLMEVLMTPDAAAPSGWRFRVQIKEIDTGLLRVSYTTSAMPPQAPPQTGYVATDTGFQKVTTSAAPVYSLEDLGRQLALETMAKF